MSNTILFYGEDTETITQNMRSYASEVLGIKEDKLTNHPDYQEVTPENGITHTMKSIHNVIDESVLPPYQSKKRVISILEAEKMLPVHSNAILKMLEDAPLSFNLYLTTTSYDDIIKTILSRVQKKNIKGSISDTSYTAEIEEVFRLLQDNKFNSFLSKLDDIDKSIKVEPGKLKQKVRIFFEQYLFVYCKKIQGNHLFNQKMVLMNNLIAEGLTAVTTNVSIKRLLENLFLETPL